MTELSRRVVLERLAAACGSAVFGCSRRSDPFARELVCIHIFHPVEPMPAPLLERTPRPPGRGGAEDAFGIGLPELIFCRARTALLDVFQHFWPFSRDDLARLRQSIEIQYSLGVIRSAGDVDDFVAHLRDHPANSAGDLPSSAVILTFNELTRPWTPDVIAASRDAGVDEFVLFKNPTLPPYLCDYPAKQKGFKRPPP